MRIEDEVESRPSSKYIASWIALIVALILWLMVFAAVGVNLVSSWCFATSLIMLVRCISYTKAHSSSKSIISKSIGVIGWFVVIAVFLLVNAFSCIVYANAESRMSLVLLAASTPKFSAPLLMLEYSRDSSPSLGQILKHKNPTVKAIKSIHRNSKLGNLFIHPNKVRPEKNIDIKITSNIGGLYGYGEVASSNKLMTYAITKHKEQYNAK